MKRQFYFDHTERDLLRTGLLALKYLGNLGAAQGHAARQCVEFTSRRIDELIERLSELPKGD